ncbi:MAG: HAD-IA family hydrolase [Actinomycetota bacterium]
MTARGIDALLFDFDGTIWDSEAAVFHAYRELYERHGHTLPVDRWVQGVGTLDGYDPVDELELLLGRELDAPVDPWTRLQDVGLRSGVRAYIDGARARGIALGIVSSNSARWIGPHLDRLGVADVWDTIRTADGDAGLAKPNPRLYELALEDLGAPPSRAIAIEDSTHGVVAAKTAGIFCVACPNEVTERLDLSAADVLVRSLEDIGLDRLVALATTAPVASSDAEAVTSRPRPGMSSDATVTERPT